MFWRTAPSVEKSEPPHQDDYDQYVWEEEQEGHGGSGDEVKHGHGGGHGQHGHGHPSVRFSQPQTEYLAEEDEEEEDGEGGERGRRVSPRLSGLFNRYGHQEGSQLLLGAANSRKSVNKMSSSSLASAGSAGSGALAGGAGPRRNPSSNRMHASGASPRGGAQGMRHATTLRARSPPSSALLGEAGGVRSDSKHQHLDRAGAGGSSNANMRRSGSMPVRLGLPSAESLAAANAAAALGRQQHQQRHSASRGSHMDEEGGMWRTVSLGGAKGMMKREGSRVVIGLEINDDARRLAGLGKYGGPGASAEDDEEAEEEAAEAIGMLVSFAYYCLFPILRCFQRSKRFVRAHQTRVLSSSVIVIVLVLCITLAALHLPRKRVSEPPTSLQDPWAPPPLGPDQPLLPPPPPRPPSAPLVGAADGGEYRNLFGEMLHKSEREVNHKLRQTWRMLFEGNAKNEAIFYSVGLAPDGDKMGYVMNSESGWVTSEGMSYGMMIAVQFNQRDVFDQLWAWAIKNMRHVTGKYKDFFAWQCSLAGQKMDATPAPDGEEWFATALIFAHTRWNSSGRHDYEGEALKLLKALADTRRGMFTDQGMVTLNPVQPTITNPSYHVPHFYEIWVRFLRDRQETKTAAFYSQAAQFSRQLLRRSVNEQTGLAADYTDHTGAGIKDLAGHSNFQWDAWRVVANVANDWAWFRRDAWQQRAADTLQAFLYSKGLHNYPSTFTLNGTSLMTIHDPGLVAVNAVASLASTDKQLATAFVSELWGVHTPRGKYRYFSGVLVLLSLLQVSGHFRAWY